MWPCRRSSDGGAPELALMPVVAAICPCLLRKCRRTHSTRAVYAKPCIEGRYTINHAGSAHRHSFS